MNYDPQNPDKHDPEYLTPGDVIRTIVRDPEFVKSLERGVDDLKNGRGSTHPDPNSLKDIVENSDPKRVEE